MPKHTPTGSSGLTRFTRRSTMRLAAAGAAAAFAFRSNAQETIMETKAFVYTETQLTTSVFDDIPWQKFNESIRAQPGFINKTWLYGAGTGSGGGVYAFDSIANAQAFVTGYFPSEAASLGIAHNTRVFDAEPVRAASVDMGSPHFGVAPVAQPGAFVYTEVQISVPFDQAPWRDRNPVLKQQKGLLSKLWLSGLHTHTIGGLDAFDTIENAKAFAIEDFPKTAAQINAAFYTRVFDATASEAGSLAMDSPYYA